MTDKQIIIEDVDVSKCKYYKEYSNPNEDGDEYNDICECSITESAFCFDECNSSCYFKNWKRKEQECKDLREDIKNIANLLDLDTGEEYNFGNIELEIKHLKAKEQECEELKAENEDLKKSILQECPNCGEEYLNYKGAALYFENSDLRQTLAKIKEIAEDESYVGFWDEQITKILQKINDCEVDNEV